MRNNKDSSNQLEDDNGYDHKEIEKKWAKIWQEKGINQIDLKTAKKPYYNLMMYPYPSAEGLHVGNMYAFTGSDVHGRFKRMQGYDVFEPIGFDSGGIHSENFAIKMGVHPKVMTERNIANFTKQLKMTGNMYDWNHSVDAMDPNYYKWTQWIFTKLFEKGLAYKKDSYITWCPSCKTTVSDEQTEKKKVPSISAGRQKSKVPTSHKASLGVGKSQNQNLKLKTESQNLKDRKNDIEEIEEMSGNENNTEETEEITVCERCKTEIERKKMKQWFFRITDYAERLLTNSSKLNWPEKVLTTQRNWIGKSVGAEIEFEIEGFEEKLKVFTTRPDTLYGCTFMVLAPEHRLINSLIENLWELKTKSLKLKVDRNKLNINILEKVKDYVELAKRKTEQDRKMQEKEKTGVFTGINVINPVNGEKIPVWVADYVLMDYGEGAVMGVPAHDGRDFDFARQYKLPIIPVVDVGIEYDDKNWQEIYHDKGIIINSDKWNGLKYPDNLEEIIQDLEDRGIGKVKTTYKLRDWCISRQRYWGPPIPMIYCPKCAETQNLKFKTQNQNSKVKNQKKVIILHGWYGHDQENWFPWLKKVLEERGYEAFVPNLPNSRYPDYKESMEFVENNYKDLFKDGENLTIVGHSLGGYMAVKLAEKYKLNNVIAVAPGMQVKLEDFPVEMREEYKKEFELLLKFYRDGGEFKPEEARKNVKDLIIFYSDNDPYINLKNQSIYKKTFLFAIKKQFRDRGHFGSRENTKQLPELLEFFKDSEADEMAGWFAVPEKDLPVLLPDIDDYLPDGTGKAPLSRHEEFVNCKCPKCGGEAYRETDVSDTFLDSSWYFLRYPSTAGGDINKEEAQNSAFIPEITKKWLPVDQYCGGAEHAVLHLMYSRFITMALSDMGYLDFEEPFPNFYAHGLIIKDGSKMSKSKRNIINPDEYIEKYGADVFRLYLSFIGPYADGGDFRDSGIVGMQKFLRRVWRLFNNKQKLLNNDRKLESWRHKTIKKVTKGIERFKYNTAIAGLMEYLNEMEKEGFSSQDMKVFSLLLAPFAPYASEEMYNSYEQQATSNEQQATSNEQQATSNEQQATSYEQPHFAKSYVRGRQVTSDKEENQIFKSVHRQKWPEFEEEKLREEMITIIIQVNGKMRGSLLVNTDKGKNEEWILSEVKKNFSVRKFIEGKEINRVILVPDKLINLVTN